MKQNLGVQVGVKNTYRFELFSASGELKWVEELGNLTVDVGLNDLLDKYFKGSAYTAAWYVGLVNSAGFTAIAAADTMASHAGWAETAAYTEGTRPALVLGTVAAKSVSNSASKAVFTFNATITLKGAFLATNSTKSGTTGILYGAAAFAADRGAETGDVLNLTATLTAASV